MTIGSRIIKNSQHNNIHNKKEEITSVICLYGTKSDWYHNKNNIEILSYIFVYFKNIYNI